MTRTLYIVIAASLLTLLPASQSSARDPSVTIIHPATNPGKTSSVVGPGRNPFQISFANQAAGGTSVTCFINVCQAITQNAIPQGKRLVVQHVSAVGTLYALQNAFAFVQMDVLIERGTLGNTVAFAATTSVKGNPSGFSFGGSALGYADPGDKIGVKLYGDQGIDTTYSTVFLTISGYLIDCTVNQCAPIAP